MRVSPPKTINEALACAGSLNQTMVLYLATQLDDDEVQAGAGGVQRLREFLTGLRKYGNGRITDVFVPEAAYLPAVGKAKSGEGGGLLLSATTGGGVENYYGFDVHSWLYMGMGGSSGQAAADGVTAGGQRRRLFKKLEQRLVGHGVSAIRAL